MTSALILERAVWPHSRFGPGSWLPGDSCSFLADSAPDNCHNPESCEQSPLACVTIRIPVFQSDHLSQKLLNGLKDEASVVLVGFHTD